MLQPRSYKRKINEVPLERGTGKLNQNPARLSISGASGETRDLVRCRMTANVSVCRRHTPISLNCASKPLQICKLEWDTDKGRSVRGSARSFTRLQM